MDTIVGAIENVVDELSNVKHDKEEGKDNQGYGEELLVHLEKGENIMQRSRMGAEGEYNKDRQPCCLTGCG